MRCFVYASPDAFVFGFPRNLRRGHDDEEILVGLGNRAADILFGVFQLPIPLVAETSVS